MFRAFSLFSALMLCYGCGFLDDPSPVEKLTGAWSLVSLSHQEDNSDTPTELVYPFVSREMTLKSNGNGFTEFITIGLFGTISDISGNKWTATETTLTLYSDQTEIMDYELNGDTLTLIGQVSEGIRKFVWQRKP